MAYEIIPSKNVKKYLKKLKEKVLKEKFLDIMYEEIALNPYQGELKVGDLAGVWTMGFNYAQVTYRIAYEIEDDKIVIVLLCGSHESFYNQLKQVTK